MAEDIVRVLRILEYVGPRARVEEAIERSLHGSRTFGNPAIGWVNIRAATIGLYPEILSTALEQEETHQAKVRLEKWAIGHLNSGEYGMVAGPFDTLAEVLRQRGEPGQYILLLLSDGTGEVPSYQWDGKTWIKVDALGKSAA